MTTSKLIVVALLLLAIVLPACGSTSSPAPAAVPPQGQATASSSSGASGGEALVNQRCAVCHNTDRIKAAKKTPDEWKATVQQMVGKGAQLTTAEQETVVKYLSDTYKK